MEVAAAPHDDVGGGYVEGGAAYTFQINGEDVYVIFLKKEKKTDWYKTGIVQSSATETRAKEISRLAD